MKIIIFVNTNVSRSARVLTLLEHSYFAEQIWSVTYNPDGTKLAAGVDDGTVVIYDTPLLQPEIPIDKEGVDGEEEDEDDGEEEDEDDEDEGEGEDEE